MAEGSSGRRRRRERGRSGGSYSPPILKLHHLGKGACRQTSQLAQRTMEPLQHSVAVDPRERAEMNAMLEATGQKNSTDCTRGQRGWTTRAGSAVSEEPQRADPTSGTTR